MSDSLRDQLLQAGFEALKQPDRPKRSPKPNRGKHSGGGGAGSGGGGGKGANRQTGKPSQRQGQRQGQQQGQQQGHRQAQHQGQGSDAAAAQAQKAREADAQIARRKAIKADIKALIEAAAIKEFQGESVYRFILNKRIRELHVKEEIRGQLVDGTLVITRLNGTTWLVPEATSVAIRELNPDWAVVTPAPDSSNDLEGYDDFPVPDDLQW